MKKGECGRVLLVKVDGAAGERLNSIGIKNGAEVRVIAFSLFSGSVLVSVGYNRVAIRKSVASRIEVEKC